MTDWTHGQEYMLWLKGLFMFNVGVISWLWLNQGIGCLKMHSWFYTLLVCLTYFLLPTVTVILYFGFLKGCTMLPVSTWLIFKLFFADFTCWYMHVCPPPNWREDQLLPVVELKYHYAYSGRDCPLADAYIQCFSICTDSLYKIIKLLHGRYAYMLS